MPGLTPPTPLGHPGGSPTRGGWLAPCSCRHAVFICPAPACVRPAAAKSPSRHCSTGLRGLGFHSGNKNKPWLCSMGRKSPPPPEKKKKASGEEPKWASVKGVGGCSWCSSHPSPLQQQHPALVKNNPQAGKLQFPAPMCPELSPGWRMCRKGYKVPQNHRGAVQRYRQCAGSPGAWVQAARRQHTGSLGTWVQAELQAARG